MAITFTLGAQSFGAKANAAGRYASDIRLASAMQSNNRWHPYATNGNLLGRGGENGTRIETFMQYVAASETALRTAFRADVAAWKAAAISITDDGGNVYTRCSLEPGSMRQLTPIKNCGRGSALVFMEATAVFISDDVEP